MGLGKRFRPLARGRRSGRIRPKLSPLQAGVDSGAAGGIASRGEGVRSVADDYPVEARGNCGSRGALPQRATSDASLAWSLCHSRHARV